jgi:hypothetical protein
MIYLLHRKIFKLINKKYYHRNVSHYYYENPQNVELVTKIRNYKSIKKNDMESYLKVPILNTQSSKFAQESIKVAVRDYNKNNKLK